ncbi:hypothetical protein NC651_003571 [Populus alba x Populus x berolinensis]|nr:hypothetical protein NC651_003571 [Populus alba x Populus x berolinensis]
MEELYSIDGVVFGSALHTFATKFFYARSKREMWAAMTSCVAIVAGIKRSCPCFGVFLELSFWNTTTIFLKYSFSIRLLEVEWLVIIFYETETIAYWYHTLNVWLVALEWKKPNVLVRLNQEWLFLIVGVADCCYLYICNRNSSVNDGDYSGSNSSDTDDDDDSDEEDLIKPADPGFVNTPRKIVNNPRYMPHFKVHIEVRDIIYKNLGGEDNHKLVKKFSTTQVQIVVASIAIHNYIRRTSMQDVTFMEFDRHPDFVPDDFLTDVAPHSQSQGHQRPSRMDYVRDEIAASLIIQL